MFKFRSNSGQKCSPEPEPEQKCCSGTGTGTGIPVSCIEGKLALNIILELYMQIFSPQ